MKYAYLGITFYERRDYYKYLDVAFDKLNYVGAIMLFPIVVLHEFLHYAPAKIMNFNPEIRLLKEGEYPAYNRILFKDTDNKYKLLIIWLFPTLVTLYILIANAIDVNDKTLYYICVLMLTTCLFDVLDAGYIFLFGVKKFIERCSS